jgi:hypothetical protein
MMDKLSYLGGLIDGEGCFTLCKARNKAVTPVFALASTSDVIINFIVLVFKEHNIDFFITQYDRKNNTKPFKTIKVQGNKRIKPLLDLVENYILEKKPQLLLLKEFVEIRNSYKQNNMKWEETDNVLSNIRKLNARGRVR